MKLKKRAFYEVLLQICLEGLGCKDIEGFLRTVGEKVSKVLKADFYKILRYEGDSVFSVVFHRGLGNIGKRKLDGNTKAYHTLRSDCPVVSEDFEREERFEIPNFVLEAGAKSGVSLPIKLRDRRWGVISFLFRGKRKFSEEEIFFLERVSGVISRFLEGSEISLIHSFLLEKSPYVVYLVEAKPPEPLNVIYVSPNVERLLGYTAEDFHTGWWVENLHPEDREEVLKNVQKLLSEGEALHTYRFKKKDGSYIWIQAYAKVVDRVEDLYRVAGYWTDVTELKEKFELLETLTNNAPVAIFLYDEKFIYANPTALRLTGYTIEELRDKYVWELVHPKHMEEVKEIIRKRLNCEKIHKEYNDFVILTKDGREITARLYADTVTYGGRCVGLAVGLDITEQRKLEEELFKVTFYDPLTGLPNRLLFTEELRSLIPHAFRRKEHIAVVILDINRFREVNTAYGTKAGDRVLKEVAHRLRNSLREGDIVGRFFADEFGIILTGIKRKRDLTIVLDKIRSVFNEPFKVNSHNFYLNANYGVALFPNDGTKAEELLGRAELALNASKNIGEGAVYFYSKEIELETVEEAVLRSSLREAIRGGEFILYYQPVLRLSDHRVVGVEALVRWNHPELGVLSPARFIPVAENTGLIIELGNFILDRALEDISKLHREGYDLFIGVNFSMKQFMDVKLVQKVKDALKKHSVAPESFLFEITESIAMRDPERTRDILSKLRNLGIKIAIDDFGTGYSSMNYLIEFDVDKIKIDRSFVTAMDETERAKSVVKTIIDLSHSVGASALAEGIEKDEHLRLLKDMGCDEGQGYLFSPPTGYDKLLEFLKSYG